MKRIPIALMVLVGSAFGLSTAGPELTTLPLPPGSRPQAIVSGPDSAVWFGTLTKLCKIGPDQKISEIPLPDDLKATGKATVLQFMVVGPDKQFWAVYRQGKVVSMSLSGKFAEFPIPTLDAGPWCLTLGPDGNLWFTELNGHKIGKVTTKGDITEFPVPSNNSGPYSIVTGSDGALWFTEYNRHQIGRITTKGEITEFPIPKRGEDAAPRGICRGADGALWFAEFGSNRIGRMTMKGELTEFDIPTPRSGVIGIGAGSDGNIWFCENKAGRVGRLTPEGKMTEYPVAEGSEPMGIIAGPDGNMWFTDMKDRIGKIRIPAEEKRAKKN